MRRGALPVLVGVLLVPGVWVLACTPSETDAESSEGAKAVGLWCDELLKGYCAYAVDQCGEPGPLLRCVENAKPTCCQGACGRSATLNKDLDTCLRTYAGWDGGADEAGIIQPAQAGLSCEQVRAGYAPAECRDIFKLLGVPEPPGVRVEATAP